MFVNIIKRRVTKVYRTSKHCIANAKPRDKITRNNGDVITLNQGDIEYAQKELAEQAASSNNGSDTTTDTNTEVESSTIIDTSVTVEIPVTNETTDTTSIGNNTPTDNMTSKRQNGQNGTR